MSAVMTIARREFKSIFVSPRAGAIFFFFLIFMGAFFLDFVSRFIEIKANAPAHGGQGPSLEELVRALFLNFHFVLVLVIPAVTMATISEEKRNHTIRLLQTAPVSASHVVMGKFLALAGVMLVVLLASFIYPLFLMKYGNPDLSVILSSYLGLFLLICAQLSFGMWVSALTSNQFMAFIFTMLGLFSLLILNWLAANISGGGTLFESVLKYIASTEHLDAFLKGMISVADVTYFVCFAGLFLFMTNVVLDSLRWR